MGKSGYVEGFVGGEAVGVGFRLGIVVCRSLEIVLFM